MSSLKTLRTWNTNNILFSGHFDSWKACLEAAIAEGVSLDYLSLSDADIGHANLDNASFEYAQFTRCNLVGANLSESSFVKAVFTECDMRDVCFSDSVAVGARFTHSQMANIDVQYADLRGVIITCPDFLKVDFSNTAHMAGSVFISHGAICPMTRRPVFMRGLGLDMVMLDEHVIVGNVIVLRRDQLNTREGMASIFSQKGLQPNQNMLAALWDTVHKLAA